MSTGDIYREGEFREFLSLTRRVKSESSIWRWPETNSPNSENSPPRDHVPGERDIGADIYREGASAIIPTDGLSSTEGPGPERIIEVMRFLYRNLLREKRARRAAETSLEEPETLAECSTEEV